MKRLIFVIALIAVSLSILLWRLPASALLLALPNPSSFAHVARLHDVDGTLWQGSARLTTALSSAAQRITWRCTPSLSASIDCVLGGAVESSLRVQPFAQTLHVDSLSLQQTLNAAPSGVATTSAQSLSVTVKDARLSRQHIAFTGSAIARDAAFAVSNTTTELGEVFVDCKPSADAKSTDCTVKNRASTTRIDGTFALMAQRATGSIEVSVPGAATQKFGF